MAPLSPEDVVFLVDVDNTLLDNDRFLDDLNHYLEQNFGMACRERYWAIMHNLEVELGYQDYLGALQRYRLEHPNEVQIMQLSSFLLDYPFAERLYPGALKVLAKLHAWGRTVILSDGDAVFQPHKITRSGLAAAVTGQVLIYIHKEQALEDVARRFPAPNYVLVDDKLRILTAIKRIWGDCVTTVFPRQGKLAHDPTILSAYPAPDITLEQVGDLCEYDLSDLQQRVVFRDIKNK